MINNHCCIANYMYSLVDIARDLHNHNYSDIIFSSTVSVCTFSHLDVITGQSNVHNHTVIIGAHYLMLFTSCALMTKN